MKHFLYIIFFSIFTLISCKKVEGPGGTSKIKGKLKVENYNSQGTVLEGTYAGADFDVYIMYGDKDSTADENVKSSVDDKLRRTRVVYILHDFIFSVPIIFPSNYRHFTTAYGTR
jgi:hypothetical protein